MRIRSLTIITEGPFLFLVVFLLPVLPLELHDEIINLAIKSTGKKTEKPERQPLKPSSESLCHYLDFSAAPAASNDLFNSKNQKQNEKKKPVPAPRDACKMEQRWLTTNCMAGESINTVVTISPLARFAKHWLTPENSIRHAFKCLIQGTNVKHVRRTNARNERWCLSSGSRPHRLLHPEHYTSPVVFFFCSQAGSVMFVFTPLNCVLRHHSPREESFLFCCLHALICWEKRIIKSWYVFNCS